MDSSSISLLKLMKNKMSYLGARQDVLAQNIANIDTPGYKARDVKKVDFEKMAMQEAGRLEIRATNGQHMTGGNAKSKSKFDSEMQRYTYETNPGENSVALEDQMKMVSETNMQYRLTTNLYQKMHALFNTAIGNR